MSLSDAAAISLKSLSDLLRARKFRRHPQVRRLLERKLDKRNKMIVTAASLTRAFRYGHSIGTPAQSKEEDGSELHLETLRY